jgi:hypothetical protein
MKLSIEGEGATQMKKLILVLVVMTAMSASAMAQGFVYGYDPAKVQVGGHWAELAQDPVPAPEGGWEYVIDLYVAGSMVSGTSYEIWGFDNDQILNLVDGASWYDGNASDNVIMECWDYYGTHNPSGVTDFAPPSVSDGANGWTNTTFPWAMQNTWHTPDEYGGGYMAFHTASVIDAGAAYGGGTARDDLIPIYNYWWSTNPAGIIITVRVVSSEHLHAGDITWTPWNDATAYPVLGNWFPDSLRGDFDGDGDIDADDVDILMANLGGDPGEFDLTDDGVVDQDDVDEWVFNIVPIGENIGTVYGDFNLDGEVNAGDLALLATNYGTVGDWGWATGDGNGDGNVDAGDLAMLATNYGTVVHPVPEPVTLSLLAVGGAALLRRRSR